MKLNQQCIQILDFLMEQEDFKNIGYISNALGCSERSVRYSLEKSIFFSMSKHYQLLSDIQGKGCYFRKRIS